MGCLRTGNVINGIRMDLGSIHCMAELYLVKSFPFVNIFEQSADVEIHIPPMPFNPIRTGGRVADLHWVALKETLRHILVVTLTSKSMLRKALTPPAPTGLQP
jgi:hypothetical protein